MSSRATKRLRDAHAACLEITRFIEDFSLEDYLRDRSLRLAIERLLEIVGEALNQATRSDPALADAIPDAFIAVGMRNRIIHGYDEIRDDIVWDAATNGIPMLRAQIENVLAATLPERDEHSESR